MQIKTPNERETHLGPLALQSPQTKFSVRASIFSKNISWTFSDNFSSAFIILMQKKSENLKNFFKYISEIIRNKKKYLDKAGNNI